jgi:hypothetical protein
VQFTVEPILERKFQLPANRPADPSGPDHFVERTGSMAVAVMKIAAVIVLAAASIIAATGIFSSGRQRKALPVQARRRRG